MNKLITDSIYITGYDPDKWYHNKIIGGKKVSPGKLGYYLGCLESFTVKELKVMINEISNIKEHDQWNAVCDDLTGKTELINALLCKYSSELIEQKIIEHHNQNL